MTEITADKSGDKSRDLSREEQEAFFAIARRLGGLNPGAPETETEAQAEAETQAAAAAGRQAEADQRAAQARDHAARAEGAARALAAATAGNETPPPQRVNQAEQAEGAETDIFAELASSVRAAMEAEAQRGGYDSPAETVARAAAPEFAPAPEAEFAPETRAPETPVPDFGQEPEQGGYEPEQSDFYEPPAMIAAEEEAEAAEAAGADARAAFGGGELPAAGGDFTAEAEAEAGAEREAAAEAENAAALRAAQISAAAHMSAQAGRIAALEAELRDLQYSSARQSFLLNALSEAVAVIDKDSIVLFANEAAGRLFGRSAAGLRGARLADMFDAAGAQALERDIAEAEARQAGLFLKPGREAATKGAAGGGSANDEAANGETTSGGARRLRLNFGGLEPGQGYFLLMRDMTRFHDIIGALLRRNSEEAEAGRRQARYLALMSHEIRTPLTALLGMAQFMAEEKAGPIENAKYKEYLRDMATAGGHIMTLLNDVLNVSGEKADWLKMAVKPMPLFGALSEALALMTPQANAANIIMRSGVARDLPPVLANARAVKQILLNLLSNAVHFTPEGGQIIISAHELQERALPEGEAAAPGGGRCILVRISDTGIGMSEEEIARTMRDPLAPAVARAAEADIAEAEAAERGGEAEDAAGSRHGAGLGLPVARALAEANGIRFSLSSEPGRGTVASLVFRVAEADKAA